MEINEKQIAELSSQVATLNKKFDRILLYIDSDPKTNTKGLVENMQIINERVNVLEDDKKKRKAQMTLISSLAAFLMILAKELWGKIVPN